LRQTADSFSDYLKLYGDSWRSLDRYSEELLDYEDRTLYSTWNISHTQIQAQDAMAAELLRLMAYFNNQDLWYELFQAGAEDQPPWWSEVMENKGRFNQAMSKLHDYSLVEVGLGRYSLHTCVHDWTMEYLNRNFDEDLWRFAVHCVAQSVKWYTEREYWVENRRLLPHAQRLEANRDRGQSGWEEVKARDMMMTAELFKQFGMSAEAEEMYVRALQGYEKAWGPEHTSTLDTVNNLGSLYKNQGKMVEAEQMYVRALQGYEKAWGPEHTSTLNTVNNLGFLYQNQGKMVEAEQMYVRALRGYEEALGPAHRNTRLIAANLRALQTIINSDHGRIN
jgi:tetratricopeptide (TPR) repeat protein